MGSLRVFLDGREITPSPLPVNSEDEAAEWASQMSEERGSYVDDMTVTRDVDCIAYLKSNDAYKREGFVSRQEYLQNLADNAGLDLNTVIALADILGPNEDFDGLVSTLEDLG